MVARPPKLISPGGDFLQNVYLDWSALEAWQPSKMTSNLPKLGLTSFLSLSGTQKTVCPKIPKIWDALMCIVQPNKRNNSGENQSDQ